MLLYLKREPHNRAHRVLTPYSGRPAVNQVKSRITLRFTWSKQQAGAMGPVRRAGWVWAASCAPAAKSCAGPRSSMPPLSTLTARATHTRPLLSAALASVPYGLVLVPVRVSFLHKGMCWGIISPRSFEFLARSCYPRAHVTQYGNDSFWPLAATPHHVSANRPCGHLHLGMSDSHFTKSKNAIGLM